MVYLARGGFWLFADRGMHIFLGLILAIGFANLLPKEAFGIYQFVLSIAGIVGVFTLTGMNTAIVQAVARGFEGALKIGTLTKLKWSIGITMAAFVVALYYFINDNNTLAISLLIVGTFAPFLESFKLYNSFLIGKKEFRAITVLGMWRKPIPIIALLVTLALTDSPLLIILVYFLSHTATTGFLYFKVLRKYKPKGSFSTEAFSYSKHLSVVNVVGRIAGNLDKILLFHFLGAAPLAIYLFSINIPKQFQSLFRIFQPLTLPKLSNRSLDELKQTLPRKAWYMFLFFIIPTGIYIVLAPYIYQLFFPQYIDSVLFSQVFAFTFLFAPASLFENTLHAHLKARELYTVTAIVPTTRIVLAFILIPLYGIWGVLATVFVAHILNLGSLIYLFRRL